MLRRVALLTNFIPPYRLPLYKAIADRVPDFQVFISTPMEANRSWSPNWDGLNVTVQKNLTLQRSWKHPHGFSENLYVHIPYDTLWSLRQYRPDVVISGEMGMRTAQALLYRKLNPNSRMILWATVSEYSELGRGKLREKLRQVLVPQADALLVNGQSGARYVRQFGVSDPSIFFAPYTTNIDPFLAVPLSRGPLDAYRLLYVGQLVERKGIEPFLSTLERWAKAHPDRTLEFWLVGEGPLRSRLEQQVWPSNLRLRFLGNVEYGKLPEVYAQGGIFAFPTLADEWGLVTNEAMAAGLPVLGSSYSQSVEELVVEGETGWQFRPDEPEEMYSALERSLSMSVAQLEQMRTKARDRIQYLTPDFVADNILKAIESVC
ncbi:glycosyltransferase family 4 protein [Laspinema olomoucense]|uniref:Glycosyltransferase family 4 protein n=1 Tax=Laspinema olomoucense D3b TaxID=2953688 RepID=A0ABT2N9K4_9CYAN|nr:MULTISPECIES: glycosyltransferase family 4 protein [unclassified Laspinema]MCT7972269.1 glycosyltransferase family 4 protein [Laspinema sp. D3d]MCT7978405.1 glycosyltransferase family 4 protein [Laspinema sp. D3b]